LRSLSSNLAYHRSSVDVSWKDYPVNNPLAQNLLGKSKAFSILLLPWPLEIQSTSFKAEEPRRLLMGESYGFFAYSPPSQPPGYFKELLKRALDAAKREVKTVDLVVLPECALSEDELKELEEVLGKESVSAYVAGVRSGRDGKRAFSENMVYFKVGRLDETRGEGSVSFGDCHDNVQYKHHRWKLDRSQITNYNLGHILSPSRHWWEAIKIRRRKVTFVNVGEEVTICPLICEDLARQDPIADLIRTVGPSLVITVLMDGPQKMDRWSARYASVLAEDPGSAVITLTSAGMVRRWRPPYRESSRVVALWNDGRGLAREIELEDRSIGILLGLCTESRQEPTADGRIELFGTNTVTLGSINQVREG
jgi:predicted amidohydrolase